MTPLVRKLSIDAVAEACTSAIPVRPIPKMWALPRRIADTDDQARPCSWRRVTLIYTHIQRLVGVADLQDGNRGRGGRTTIIGAARPMSPQYPRVCRRRNPALRRSVRRRVSASSIAEPYLAMAHVRLGAALIELVRGGSW